MRVLAGCPTRTTGNVGLESFPAGVGNALRCAPPSGNPLTDRRNDGRYKPAGRFDESLELKVQSKSTRFGAASRGAPSVQDPAKLPSPDRSIGNPVGVVIADMKKLSACSS